MPESEYFDMLYLTEGQTRALHATLGAMTVDRGVVMWMRRHDGDLIVAHDRTGETYRITEDGSVVEEGSGAPIGRAITSRGAISVRQVLILATAAVVATLWAVWPLMGVIGAALAIVGSVFLGGLLISAPAQSPLDPVMVVTRPLTRHERHLRRDRTRWVRPARQRLAAWKD